MRIDDQLIESVVEGEIEVYMHKDRERVREGTDENWFDGKNISIKKQKKVTLMRCG